MSSVRQRHGYPFLSLAGISIGYAKENVTPYMHAMVYHVPRFLAKLQGIKKFTGQGVEKNNDDCRRIHLQKSNKWDAAKDVLLVSKRLELLSECERTPRNYKKRNAEYWETTIKEKRACRSAAMKDNSTNDVANMATENIKAKLVEMGIRTRLRNVKRLQELLENALELASQTY